MENFEKILVLNNVFEAERMEEILTAKEIPYAIIMLGDSVLGGITQLEKGWGYLEAPERFREEIMEIFREISVAGEEGGDEESEGK
jgi:hypothetical protein